MFEINKIDNTWVVTFSEDQATPEFMEALYAKAHIESIVQNSELTKEQANELSNEVKASYWEANKDWILKKIGKNL